MNTFITDFDMAQNARNLDDKRLGKQRVEALQIAECLLIKKSRWKNHPAVRMWRGYERYLIDPYLLFILNEWEHRRFKNWRCYEKYLHFKYIILDGMTFPHYVKRPPWITEEFIESHRSNLIRKKPEHYRPLFPHTKEGLEYIWPVK